MLVCQSWLSVKFAIQRKTTKQALYICKKIHQLYFYKAICIDIRILPEDLPNSMATLSTQYFKYYALIHLALEGVVSDVLLGSLGSFVSSNIIFPSPSRPYQRLIISDMPSSLCKSGKKKKAIYLFG